MNYFGHFVVEYANKKNRTRREFNAILIDSKCDNNNPSELENIDINFLAFTTTIGRYSSKFDIDSYNEKNNFEFILNKFYANSLDRLFIDLIGFRKENDMLFIEATKLNNKLKTYELNSSMLEIEKLELSKHIDGLNLNLVGLK